MYTFKQWLTEAAPPVMWASDYYSDWGYIDPHTDRVIRAPGDEECHEDLAAHTGYKNTKNALKMGLVRFSVSRKNGSGIFEVAQGNTAAMPIIAKFIKQHEKIHGSIYLDVLGSDGLKRVASKEWRNPGVAAQQIRSMRETGG